MSTVWTASSRSLRAFEALNIGLWFFTAILIATVFKNNRGYWILLLSWTAVFPLSAWADEYVLFIRYNPGFHMLFWRCPVMIPFAFGWFFTLPLILIWESGVIAWLSLPVQVAIVFVVFVGWGFMVEVASASSNLYVYRWPERWKIGGMPWPVAIIDGIVHTLTYLLFGIVVQLTTSMEWLPATGIGVLVYDGMFIAFALLNGLLIKRVLHVTALPM